MRRGHSGDLGTKGAARYEDGKRKRWHELARRTFFFLGASGAMLLAGGTVALSNVAGFDPIQPLVIAILGLSLIGVDSLLKLREVSEE